MTRVAGIFIASAIVCVAPLARADDAPAGELEVRITGDRDDALRKTPGSGQVITEADLRRQQPANVGEALRRVPGLVVRQDESGGARLDIGVRGLDPTRSRRVLLLEDGVPIEINPYAEPDLYFAPPIDRYREIEVVKGSGSILFGPQTIGGVINFLTIEAPEHRKITLEADGGSYGHAKYLAAYGDGFRGVRYVVQALHEQATGARDEPWQADDVLAKLAFDTSARGKATIKFGFHDERAVSTETGETEAMYRRDPQRETFAPDDFLHVRKWEVSVLHEHRFTPETALRTLAYAYTTSRIWRRQDADRSPIPGALYDRIVGDPSIPGGALYFSHSNAIVDRTYDVAGLEPKLEQRFKTGALAHELEVGARAVFESGHRAQRAGQDPGSFAGDLQVDETHRTVAVAGYALDRVSLGSHLVVSPGLRIERVQYDRDLDRDLVLGVPTDEAIHGATYDTGVVPGVGMVLGGADLHAFGGVHVGYAPPRIVTAISNTGVDELLEPEKSVAWELGARARHGRLFRAELTGYLTNFTNQIVTGNALTGARTTLINGGATRHLGAEAAATLGVGALARLPLTVDLGGNATVSRATFVGGPYAGDVLPYAPAVVATATLDVEHASGISAQIAATFTGRQFTDELDTVVVDPTGQDGAIDPYVVVDAALRYKHARSGLSATASLKNLSGSTYVLSRRPDGIFPGSPRTFTLGLRWEPGSAGVPGPRAAAPAHGEHAP